MTARSLAAWSCYAASSAIFVLIVVVVFHDGNLIHGPIDVLLINAVFFAAAGVAAISVRNLFFNAIMTIASFPYLLLIGFDPFRETNTMRPMEIKGQFAYLTLYVVIGCLCTLFWIIGILARIALPARKSNQFDRLS